MSESLKSSPKAAAIIEGKEVDLAAVVNEVWIGGSAVLVADAGHRIVVFPCSLNEFFELKNEIRRAKISAENELLETMKKRRDTWFEWNDSMFDGSQIAAVSRHPRPDATGLCDLCVHTTRGGSFVIKGSPASQETVDLFVQTLNAAVS